MRCQYCGRIIPDDSAFCPECGQRQEELSFHAESSFDSTQESKPKVQPRTQKQLKVFFAKYYKDQMFRQH